MEEMRDFREFEQHMQENYGVGALGHIVNGDLEEDPDCDRYCFCPECGDPIYDCDYHEIEYDAENDEYVCPICECAI